MKVEMWSIDKVIPYARNPRKNDAAVPKVMASLKEYGFRQPIVVDKEGVVIVGHTRLKAAQQLGMTEVPVHTATGLTASQVKAYRIADNRTSEEAEWDQELLGLELSDLREADFDLNLTGFDGDTIEKALNPDEPEVKDVDAQVDRAEELRQKWNVETGQIWTLGKHRMMCGDSTRAEDVERLMAGAKADAVVTDPPYGIGFGYDKHDDDRGRWFDLMDRIVPQLKQMGPFVVMPSCGIDRIGWWYANHAPDWMLCWYKGIPGHLSKVGFNDWEAHLVWGRPPKQMHDFWQTKCGFEVDGHPCPKPVEYAAWLVERAAEKSGLLFEPFCGSGTTLIAAEQLGRRCFGMEISPAYCAVILQRWADATGGTPCLAKQ